MVTECREWGRRRFKCLRFVKQCFYKHISPTMELAHFRACVHFNGFDPSCKPPIPALPRGWGLPPAAKSGTSYKFALLALTFSNVPAPPASATASFYAGGAFQTFITGASSGCASYTIEGFAVPLGIAEKRNGGSCAAIVQPEDLPNNMQTTGSFVAANYDTIITMVVNNECATSGSSGNGVRTINGINVTSNFLFNSVRASVVQQSSCSGWSCPLPVSQLGMVHEMLHMFRYLQHSNAYQCLSEPSNTLKCTLYEYGDMFDTVGGAKLLAGFRAHAHATILAGLGAMKS